MLRTANPAPDPKEEVNPPQPTETAAKSVSTTVSPTMPPLADEELEQEQDFDEEPPDVTLVEMESEIVTPRRRSEPPPDINIPVEERNMRIDFTPYISQLAPSTIKILEEEYHAHFIHIIRPKQPQRTTEPESDHR